MSGIVDCEDVHVHAAAHREEALELIDWIDSHYEDVPDLDSEDSDSDHESDGVAYDDYLSEIVFDSEAFDLPEVA